MYYQNEIPDQYKHRKSKLIRLLTMYTCKGHIKMKPLMKSLLKQLHKNRPLSTRQLEVIIPYIQRDLHGYSHERIMDWFSCCLYDRKTTEDNEYWEKHDPIYFQEFLKPEIDRQNWLNSPATLDPFFE